MGPEDLKMLHETYRLALENNKLLHKMRRAALVRGVVWALIYAGLIIAPIWFYMTYLNASVENLLRAYDQMQGGGAQAESQYANFRQALEQLQSKVQSLLPASSSGTSTQ